ncbi:MAG: serine/threonine protein kinase, partial [Bacteroidetes bacterium]|nr:serine/threonine protein kinase [Bacteroidota bacterium]
MVGKRLSQYQIIEELGRGGMGVVYKATDTELQRDVALKVMTSLELASEEARSRFRLEGQAAAQLNHPNIATIYQIGEDQGKMFIAMEFIEGSTVEKLLEASDLSFENAMRIGVQLADGLAAANIQGVVHRDIKPANVMVDGSGRVKILDFGLAKMEQSSNLTAEGATVGTFAYMSPEQLRGESVGAATDAWAFGVMLYEMLAGKRPFEAAYDAALSFQILNEDPPELDESIPEDLREGIGTLLTKDEATRNKDVQAVVS